VTDDRRLIEDLIPVEAINEVGQREKIGHAATHPRKLHLWWARRPLAAARAAVYATLVRAEDTPEEARSAAYFRELCKWGAGETAIADARARVLAANGGTPPRVLDLFAGGGAIPLEAARLGCEATAVELNPVAHLIERCMLDYPQRFGPSLADDIRRWGERWVARTWERVGHFYPRVGKEQADDRLFGEGGDGAAARAAGRPIAYLWTRTVPCPNQALGAHDVPLVRQTWLAKRKGRNVALKPNVDRNALHVDWEVVEAPDPAGLGFDPAGFSKRGRSACLICGATVDGDYVKAEGRAKRMGITPLAAVMVHASGRGREYRAVGDYPLPSYADCETVLDELEVSPPDEPVCSYMDAGFRTAPYGLTRFRDLFTPRQLATLCAFAQGVRETYEEMRAAGVEETRAEAVCALLALSLNRTADRCCSLSAWDPKNQTAGHAFARQALPMVWDFVEVNPFAGAAGSILAATETTARIAAALSDGGRRVDVQRSSATQLSLNDEFFDAIITDPPYYDNIAYADLSDFFYVWLNRSIGFLFPEHLTGELTPKRREITSFAERHGDDTDGHAFYKQEMAAAFAEAHRVLKPGAPLVCVYAHKTTLGWASLVEALRRARFAITEAWPLDTEMPERSRGQNSSALASSIFLVARRRERDEVGELAEVQRDLDAVIAERLDRLTAAGVSGSDLVIAAIGAGLQPYTRYASVELPNGEELPAERFLEDVQGRVLAAVLRKVHGLGDEAGSVDAATRYYVLARTFYGYAPVDFDEANNLARTVGVELSGLGHGPARLAAVGKGKVALLDYSERGEEPELGLAANGDGRARVIDVAHGLLWRASHQRHSLREYLDQARPDADALRWVVQALQGEALRDGGPAKHPEAQACERLLGAWRTVVEDNLFSGSA